MPLNNLKLHNATNRLLPLELLIWVTQQNIILPFYHTINDAYLPHVSNLYRIRSVKEFENDLDYLCKSYTPIDIEKLFSLINRNEKPNKKYFHLTFDDGLHELYTIVAPILIKKGIPATIFINSAFLDNTDLFFRYKISLIIDKINSTGTVHNGWIKDFGLYKADKMLIKKKLLTLNYHQRGIINKILGQEQIEIDEFLSSQKPYLTTKQVKDLINQGFQIGGHSVDHPHFKDISYEDQQIQFEMCFSKLQDLFNIKKRYFSFPFSDENVSSQYYDWMFDSQNCSLSFGISGLKHDYSKYHLHRIPFEQDNMTAEEILKWQYTYYILKSFMGKNKIKRK